MYARVRERNDLDSRTYLLRYFNRYNPAGVDIRCNQTQKANGQRQIVYDMGSTKFRPGLPIKINPVCMQKVTNTVSCTDVLTVHPGKVENPVFYYRVELIGDWLSGNFPVAAYTPNSPTSIDSKLSSWLVQQARAKGNSGQVSVGVTLGELPQTIGMILSPFGKVLSLTTKTAKKAQKIISNAQSVRSLVGQNTTPLLAAHRAEQIKDGVRRATKTHSKKEWYEQYAKKASRVAREAVDALSNLWLSYIYGLSPLASEIDAYFELAAHMINRAVRDDNYYLERVAEGIVSDNSSTSKRYRQKTQDGWFYMDVEENVHYSDRYTGHAYFSHKSNVPQPLLEQLGLHQPLSVLWELVPGSFVLDWVFNVGQFLSCLAPKAETTLVGQCATRKITSTHSYTIHGGNLIYDGRYANLQGQFITQAEQLVRMAIPLGKPIQLINPSLGRSFTRNISLAALSWQQVQKYF